MGGIIHPTAHTILQLLYQNRGQWFHVRFDPWIKLILFKKQNENGCLHSFGIDVCGGVARGHIARSTATSQHHTNQHKSNTNKNSQGKYSLLICIMFICVMHCAIQQTVNANNVNSITVTSHEHPPITSNWTVCEWLLAPSQRASNADSMPMSWCDQALFLCIVSYIYMVLFTKLSPSNLSVTSPLDVLNGWMSA